MYKAVFAAYGVLTVPLQDSGRAATVDAGLYGALAGVLVAGDWTYLRLRDAKSTEIVKVIGLLGANTVAIIRGIDGTIPSTFLGNTAIKYVDTVAAFLDSIVPHALSIVGNGGIVVKEHDVSYAPVVIYTLGGTQIAGSEIGSDAGAGCCDLIPEVTPAITRNYEQFRITDAMDYRTTGDGDYRITI